MTKRKISFVKNYGSETKKILEKRNFFKRNLFSFEDCNCYVAFLFLTYSGILWLRDFFCIFFNPFKVPQFKQKNIILIVNYFFKGSDLG